MSRKLEHFELHVRSMERLGISAAIIEDKTGLKKNSLFGNEVAQTQDRKPDPGERHGRRTGARRGLSRNRCGRHHDTHPRPQAGRGIRLRAPLPPSFPSLPLVCLPTSDNNATEEELAAHGFNIVIYAGHQRDSLTMGGMGHAVSIASGILEALGYVDEVVLSKWMLGHAFPDQHRVDLLVHGHDNSKQKHPVRLHTLSRTESVGSTGLRSRVLDTVSGLIKARDAALDLQHH